MQRLSRDWSRDWCRDWSRDWCRDWCRDWRSGKYRDVSGHRNGHRDWRKMDGDGASVVVSWCPKSARLPKIFQKVIHTVDRIGCPRIRYVCEKINHRTAMMQRWVKFLTDMQV